MAKTESVTAQMTELLDEISENLKESVEKNAKDCSRGSASQLRNSSPKRTGKYAASWASKKLGEGSYITYNKEGWKTHILENGHVIRNKKGTYGRWNGIKHIDPVEKEYVEKFEAQIMRDEI